MAKEEGRGGSSWRKYEEESVVALYTPFFVTLDSGTLDSKIFLHCISESFHSLQSFLEVFERAEAYTHDHATELAIRHLRESVEQNLDTYQTFVQKYWGLALPNESCSDETAIKYVEFLLTTASGEQVLSKFKVAANTLAAIAPFMRLYEHLCNTTLVSDLYPDDNILHFYTKWIQEIEALTKETEKLLDKLSEKLTKEELQVTEKHYDQAMKLQLEFFASQPISQQTVVPYLSRVQESQLTIFSDFDWTCSLGESTDEVLTREAILKSGFAPQKLQALSDQYLDGFLQCLENIITSDVPGDYEGLKQALTEVADYEKNANATVEDLGLLKELSLDVLKKAGQRIKLQKGCREFFQKIVKIENPKIDVHIISYSWCGDLIRSAFYPDLEVLSIHSNELVCEEFIMTGEMVSTGVIDKKVETPFDKLQVYMQVLENHKSSTTSQGKHIKIYIGEFDDILCLVEADIGIVFGASTSLRKLGKRFGLSFVPLHDGVVKNQMGLNDWRPQCGILYTVTSWAEIEAFILGWF